MFVPATPGSELKKRYTKMIERSGINVAVAEVPGTTLKRKLQRSDIDKKRCGKSDCMVCREGGGGERCRKESCLYEIKCSECEEVYIGESSSNAYTRGLQHSNALEKEYKSSVLLAHTREKHTDCPNPPVFTMTVRDIFTGDATKRQVAEALCIENTPNDFS